ncbi:hypothetical protein ACROYT_G044219 [Oculina patagonica]
MAETLLRKKKETSVCVFEKEDWFGGRILDHRFPQAPDITVGLGAWRVVNDATKMINLIQRLNISTIQWDYTYPSILESRGVFSNDSMTIKNEAFPTLNTGKFRNMTSNEMASYAFKDEYVTTAPLFASVDAYMSYYLTPEGAEFLSELYGFKGDYTESINPAAYIEYLTLPISGKHRRPLKGMSEVIDALVSSVRFYGGTLYKNSEVSSIEKVKTKFILTTSELTVSAKKIVVATHPVAFMKIKGSVAEEIQREPAFQSITSMPAFKGAAVYKKAWWSDSMATNLTLEPRQKFISNSNCLGVTLPHGGRGPNGEGVLHTMYMDGACSRRWGDILRISKSAVDRELKRALEYKFGGPVPDPLDTVYQYWDEGAWHFQKPGSNITLSEVSNWAKRPFPKQEIFVIGDAYNPYRGWTQGAIMSADNALLEGWQIHDKSSSQKKDNMAVSLSEIMRNPSKDLQNH